MPFSWMAQLQGPSAGLAATPLLAGRTQLCAAAPVLQRPGCAVGCGPGRPPPFLPPYPCLPCPQGSYHGGGCYYESSYHSGSYAGSYGGGSYHGGSYHGGSYHGGGAYFEGPSGRGGFESARAAAAKHAKQAQPAAPASGAGTAADGAKGRKKAGLGAKLKRLLFGKHGT